MSSSLVGTVFAVLFLGTELLMFAILVRLQDALAHAIESELRLDLSNTKKGALH